MKKEKKTAGGRNGLLGVLILGACLCLTACQPKTAKELPESVTKEAEVTKEPIAEPTAVPTAEPTKEPTAVPTEEPSATPTRAEAAPIVVETPVEAAPVVELGPYQGLTLVMVSEETVDDEIRSRMEEYYGLTEVDRPAALGDTVNINYTGLMDGVAFEGGTEDSEEGYDLLLGSGQFIPGFEEGLIGACAGEEVCLELTFPDPYLNNPELSGVPVTFVVQVNAVLTQELPELTDVLAFEIFSCATVEELRQTLKESLNQQTFYAQLADSLLESSQVTNLSEERLTEKVEEYANYYLSLAQYYGAITGMDTDLVLLYYFGAESETQLREYLRENVIRELTYESILLEIARRENITVSEEAFAAAATRYAGENGYETVEELIAAYGEEELRKVVLTDLAADFCIEHAVLVEE